MRALRGLGQRAGTVLRAEAEGPDFSPSIMSRRLDVNIS
jgi:hypothetical protein